MTDVTQGNTASFTLAAGEQVYIKTAGAAVVKYGRLLPKSPSVVQLTSADSEVRYGPYPVEMLFEVSATTGTLTYSDSATVIQRLPDDGSDLSAKFNAVADALGSSASDVASAIKNGKTPKSISELQSYTDALDGDTAYLSLGGRSGPFQWDGSDLSVKVAADPLQGVYIAPASDVTGASGAWVRKLDGFVTPEMFGGGEDGYDYAVSFIKAIASDQSDTSPVIGIECSGKYEFSTQKTLHPWIKHTSKGAVWFDFSGLDTAAVAIKITGEGSPSASWKNAANTGSVFTGSFLVTGPDTAGTSIGLKIGNDANTGSEQDARDIIVGDIVCSNFSVLYAGGVKDTYIGGLVNSRLETAGTAAVQFSGTTVNSGERIVFFNDTIAGAPVGFDVKAVGIDIVAIACSIDFCRNIAATFSTPYGYQKLTLAHCHLEASNDVALIKSESTDYSLSVVITDCKLVPRNTDQAVAALLHNVRTDKLSVPRVALFQGKMSLLINGLTVGGYEAPLASADGLFMCDDDVDVLDVKGVVFTGYRQAISKRCALNYNWDFSGLTAGTFDNRVEGGWVCRSRSGGITGSISTDRGFGDSAKSLKLVCSGTASDYYSIETTEFPIDPGKSIVNQHIVYAAGSAGLIRVKARFAMLRNGRHDSVSVSGISRSGWTATMTTATAHGLNAGQRIKISGCDQVEYNGWKTVISVPTSTTMTFIVANTAVSPATGSPAYECDSLISVGETSNVGTDFSDIYGDTDDPSYTGARNFWAKERTIFPTAEWRTLAVGVTHAKLVLEISQMNSGDTIYVGGGIVNRM